MSKRALLVGINQYDNAPLLSCCVDDAKIMRTLLEKHEDGSPNYDSRLLSSENQRVTTELIRSSARALMSNLPGGDVVFYFSGHGVLKEDDAFLLCQDSDENNPGFGMQELLEMANASDTSSVLIVLDCCHSGAIGEYSEHLESSQITLAEGVTILASSSAPQTSEEGMGNSLFTELVIGALEGGAADVRGQVSAAGVYGYVEQALSSWQQRPMYKSHARNLLPLRICRPLVSDETLREMKSLFRSPRLKYQMDPTYEHTEQGAIKEHIEIFNTFKLLRDAALLRSSDDTDLYYTSLNSATVELTRLGKFYWKLVANGRI